MMEADLGQSLWHLHVPGLDYKIYATAQKITAGHLQRQANYLTWALKATVWVTTFFCSMQTTRNYHNLDENIDVIILLFIVYLIFILQLGTRKAIIKTMYNIHGCAPYDIVLGQGGILLASDSYAELLFWSEFSAPLRDKNGLYLLTKSFAVVSVPDAVLKLHPEASALIDFIEQKISSSNKA
jgi:hypothetical protein